ncbi:MAG: phosphocholine cytidylyltransferase family protein [Candidatus Pacearchaeota archaeon]|nr:phosphocholine cytidylyltransferase family protein [Candidatus Pacearchaeota archaeon]
MKAIILAAGLGTRLGKYTQDKPKCMLEFMGKTLIERQVETIKKLGIKEIIVIRGHFGGKINLTGVTYVEWSGPETNMVPDLFEAEKYFDDDFIVVYGDVLFDEKTFTKLMNCDKDICVTVDDNWKDYWRARFNSNLEDLESVHIGKEGDIIELGTPDCLPEDCHARYVGLIKFSKNGAKALKKVYHENKEKYWDKDEKWMNSKNFKRAYMTDILQAIINSGFKIWPLHIFGGWLEFDTVNDYELANRWLKEGILNKFIRIDGN